MTAIVPFKGNLPATTLREKVLARLADGTAPVVHGGSRLYVRFNGNTGAMSAGKDNTSIGKDDLFLISAGLARHGVMEWVGKKPSGQKRLVPFIDGWAPSIPVGALIKGSDADRPLEGWADTVILDMVGYGGDFDGIALEFALHADSAREAGIKVVDAMFTRLKHGETHFNACVRIGVDSYMNTKWSRDIFYPVFEIVGWASDDDVQMLADASDDDPLA